MKVGTSNSEMAQNAFERTYNKAVKKIVDHLNSTTGKVHVKNLCSRIEQPMEIRATDLDTICLAMRAAADAIYLLPHLTENYGLVWENFTVESCCKVICHQLKSFVDEKRQLLKDHFILGVSGSQAAANIFGQRIRQALTNLHMINKQFAREARFSDGASASFAAVTTETQLSLDSLHEALYQVISAQTKKLEGTLTRGLEKAALAVSQHLESLTKSEESMTKNEMAVERDSFDSAMDTLDVIQIAEQNLAELVNTIKGQYSSSCKFALTMLQEQSEMAISGISHAKKNVGVNDNEPILCKLLFLLQARSSSLRKHFVGEDQRHFDNCYEEAASKVIEWHSEVVEGVLALDNLNDHFVRNLKDYRQQIELSMEIAELASVEKIQCDQHAVLSFAQWQVLVNKTDKLTKRISIKIEVFSEGVESRLKHHTSTLATSTFEMIEAYDYAEHALDLAILESARWCDTILETPIIEDKILTVWNAFEGHMKMLAHGEDGVLNKLSKGKHQEARTLLVRIRGMETLWKSKCASVVSCVEVAQSVKAIHDKVRQTAEEMINDRCQTVRTKVLERAHNSQWWMDMNVKDAHVTDALWQLNSTLDLAQWFITFSKNHNRLRDWLQLEELEKVQIDCKNSAQEMLSRLNDRVQSMFAALGTCELLSIDAAVEQFVADIFVDAEETALSEEIDPNAAQSLATKNNKMAISMACRELKDILHMLSRPTTYPALFSAVHTDDDPQSAPNDLAIFQNLQRIFQQAYLESINNFGSEETEPAARQKVLNIYSTFTLSLPTDKIFEGFRKIAADFYPALIQAHQSAKRSENAILRSHFASREFTDETFRMLNDLSKSGANDSRARAAYVQVCGTLATPVRALIQDMTMNFVHLKYPEQSFSTQEHLVKPWNQLQAARSHVCFLKDAPGDSFDLEAELVSMLQKFETILTMEVLKPFARMFDMGQYSDAEGNESFGLKRVSILVMQLQSAQGGQLHEVATRALNEERDRQREVLKTVHLVPFSLPSLMEGEDNTQLMEERVQLIDHYLERCFARIHQMSQCKGDCDIITEYSEAKMLLSKQARDLVVNEFGPVLKECYLNMSKWNVDYLESLHNRMDISSYTIDIVKMINLQIVKQNIEQFRQMHQNVRHEIFSSMSPQEQAEAIFGTSPQHKSYIPMVHEFDATHKLAVEKARHLLTNTPYDQILPRALDTAFDEVRARTDCAHKLKVSKISPQDIARLDEDAYRFRANVEHSLPKAIQNISNMPSDVGENVQDNNLLRSIQTYTSIVKIAPFVADSSLLGTTTAAEVINTLKIKLNETIMQFTNVPETPQHISLKHKALLRLERWDPTVAVCHGKNDQISMFEAAADLESVLFKEGSILERQDSALVPPVSHERRVHKVIEEISGLIDTAKDQLSKPYDPKIDPSIDPKPFEMILSREMDELIACIAPQLRIDVVKLKTAATDQAKHILAQLQEKLSKKKNQEAAGVLESWKFLEPLTRLSAFEHLPGPDDFKAELVKHAEMLSTSAMSAVRSSSKDDGWQKLVTMPVLFLAKFGSDIPRAALFSNEKINEVLDVAQAKFGVQGMQQLAVELRDRDPALGNEIIASSEAFIQVAIVEFNQKTQRDISVVKKLYADRNGGADDAVWSKYEEFEKEYDRLLSDCTDGLQQHNDPLAFLVQEAQKKVAADKSMLNWSGNQQRIPQVLGAIFAWWSMDFLLKLRKRNPHLTVDACNVRRITRRPNNGQVVCILQLLGASMKTISLHNHLAEVPTGEGKSVIIGVLATALGLYGFRVDCVCYSSMLSSRDHDDFAPMFTSFGLIDKIRYGTFDTLSEALLSEQYGDLRESARQYISADASTKKTREQESPRILVIDEVDVFCSENFFGGAYCPQLELKNERISELMRHIWSVRSSKFDLDSFKNHANYRAVLSSGVITAKNEWLLEHAVREMHKSARLHKQGMHGHIVRNGEILYKVEGRDEYSRCSYSYETNAEYLTEFEHGNLTEQQLDAHLAIHVRCGEFSFATLPSMFQHILGVTGTLSDDKLPPQMKDILRQEVRIKDFTYCPSMYHEQKRDFEPTNPKYVRLAKDIDEHYNLIVDEIEDRLMPTTKMEGARSVIVFFRDADEISKFRDSSYFSQHKAKANVLTELTVSRREDRDNIIKSATRQGMITLASCMFGRGTDFKIFDDRMEKAGGMHVLQTFFSRDLSEEVQIQGRCARQGNKGSYSQVLLRTSLSAQFDLTPETVDQWPSAEVYSNLSRLRAEAGSDEVRALREMAVKRIEEHKVLASSLKAFHKGRTEAFDQLMRRYNSASHLKVGPNGLHIILCLDESGSMGGEPWDELVNAFNVFWMQSAAEPTPAKHVSVVQFGTNARVTQQMIPLRGAAPGLSPVYSGTNFFPAIKASAKLIDSVAGPNNGYTAVVIFMSDGHAGDVAQAVRMLESLAQQHGNGFCSYTVGFGSGAPSTLEFMAFANGVQDKNNYRSASVGSLANVFSAVATSISPGRL